MQNSSFKRKILTIKKDFRSGIIVVISMMIFTDTVRIPELFTVASPSIDTTRAIFFSKNTDIITTSTTNKPAGFAVTGYSSPVIRIKRTDSLCIQKTHRDNNKSAQGGKNDET